MHLSLIGQLPTPLNEGHLFPGSHSGWAEPRLLAPKIGKLPALITTGGAPYRQHRG
jgi:hypothetical protein